MAGLVDSCPTDYQNSTIQERCERGAQGLVSTGELTLYPAVYYKNIYCAVCNAVDIQELLCRVPRGTELLL